jgi:DNA polymerase-3 subunit gamma/tau
MACLARDLLVIKTTGSAGITMLSGVASDKEVLELTKQLSSGELVRMMNLIQATMQSFTRSASRRMDAELCILELCQPELSMDAKAINARITRIEEQLRSGTFVTAAPRKQSKKEVPEDIYDEDELPPLPDDEDAPPVEEEVPPPLVNEAPMGFWQDLVAAARAELRVPAKGYFNTNPTSPLKGVLVGTRLELRCENSFIADIIGKPDVLEIVSRKASSLLGRPVQAAVVDLSVQPKGNANFDRMIEFGKAHPDVVKIRNN